MLLPLPDERDDVAPADRDRRAAHRDDAARAFVHAGDVAQFEHGVERGGRHANAPWPASTAADAGITGNAPFA